MDANRAIFPKSERLSWKRHVDTLFAGGSSFIAYPLRVIYFPVEGDGSECRVSVLVNVSKKKLKRAVDRNFIKRRIRENYRLRKHMLTAAFDGGSPSLLLAFLYIDDRKTTFAVLGRAMEKALRTLGEKIQ
ncbi:MAG: ribonuclease P protein component [Tannerella sp.]|jgi:ribonuclease P protein component|nr:ribonuclease P protein component [Tannerella sp.]